jgi:hypothetical protein
MALLSPLAALALAIVAVSAEITSSDIHGAALRLVGRASSMGAVEFAGRQAQHSLRARALAAVDAKKCVWMGGNIGCKVRAGKCRLQVLWPAATNPTHPRSQTRIW